MNNIESKWAQVEPLAQDRINVGCPCCSSAGRVAHLDRVLAVGFGDVTVSKDGEYLYSEIQQTHADKDYWTMRDAEKLAAEDPDHDWRVAFYGPLHGETYQRHNSGRWAGQWVCIESNEGFA